MEPGMQVPLEALVEVLQSRIATAAVKEASMEAAIQSLLKENAELTEQLRRINERETDEASAEIASAVS